MKKLTIAIPTYNRAEILLATLNDLAKDDNIYNIYISDNCSEDKDKRTYI
jgi:glycosyltransferase involved in cell wall biosynthesis